MKEVIKAIEYRFYPTNEQILLIERTFGACRLVRNARVIDFNINKNTFIGPLKPVPKTIKEFKVIYPFLNNCIYNAIEQCDRDFNKFKTQYFQKIKLWKQNPILNKFPCKAKLKTKKNNTQSFRLHFGGDGKIKNGTRIKDNKLMLSKLGFVKIKGCKDINSLSNINNVTVKRKSQKYFIVVNYTEQVNELPKTGLSIGVDFGLNHIISDNFGNKVDNPRYYRTNESKIKHQQRHMSRKKKGSNRFLKCKKKLNSIHEKLARKRELFNHTLSKALVSNFDIICLENLSVKSMIKNRKLSKSIADAGWSQLKSMILYKSNWYGKDVVEVDRYYPSSKTCSQCGNKYVGKMSLAVREWQCKSCNTIHDRDINAAKNILREGLTILHSSNTL